MQAVFSEKKPNCLILDEIDGLTGGEKGAVKELLKIVSAKDKKGKGKQRYRIYSSCDFVYFYFLCKFLFSNAIRSSEESEGKQNKGKKGKDRGTNSPTKKMKKGSSVLDLGKMGRKKNTRSSASDLKTSLTPSGKLRRCVSRPA
jgi:hypothetical protein